MTFSHSSPYSKLTDEQHQLIGMFVAEWATCEFLLSTLLGRLLLAPGFLSRTFTDRLSAAAVQDSIAQAVEIHKYRYSGKLVGPDLLEEITVLNRKVGILRSIRNKFAHYCWMRTSDEKMFGTNFSGSAPSDKQHKRSFSVLEISEIRSQYAELYAAVERLDGIVKEIPEITEEEAIKAFQIAIKNH